MQGMLPRGSFWMNSVFLQKTSQSTSSLPWVACYTRRPRMAYGGNMNVLSLAHLFKNAVLHLCWWLSMCSGLSPLYRSRCESEPEPGRSGGREIREQGAAEGASEKSRCRRRGVEALALVQACCGQFPVQMVGSCGEGDSQGSCWHENHSQVDLRREKTLSIFLLCLFVSNKIWTLSMLIFPRLCMFHRFRHNVASHCHLSSQQHDLYIVMLSHVLGQLGHFGLLAWIHLLGTDPCVDHLIGTFWTSIYLGSLKH